MGVNKPTECKNFVSLTKKLYEKHMSDPISMGAEGALKIKESLEDNYSLLSDECKGKIKETLKNDKISFSENSGNDGAGGGVAHYTFTNIFYSRFGVSRGCARTVSGRSKSADFRGPACDVHNDS